MRYLAEDQVDPGINRAKRPPEIPLGIVGNRAVVTNWLIARVIAEVVIGSPAYPGWWRQYNVNTLFPRHFHEDRPCSIDYIGVNVGKKELILMNGQNSRISNSATSASVLLWHDDQGQPEVVLEAPSVRALRNRRSRRRRLCATLLICIGAMVIGFM